MIYSLPVLWVREKKKCVWERDKERERGEEDIKRQRWIEQKTKRELEGKADREIEQGKLERKWRSVHCRQWKREREKERGKREWDREWEKANTWEVARTPRSVFWQRVSEGSSWPNRFHKWLMVDPPQCPQHHVPFTVCVLARSAKGILQSHCFRLQLQINYRL